MGKKELVIILILSLSAATAGFFSDGDSLNPDIAEFTFMSQLCFSFFTLVLLAAGYVRDRIFTRGS